MKSKIIYNNQEIDLIEEFIDVGYMAENFCAKDINDNDINITRTKKDVSIIILLSMPNKQEYQDEILRLDKLLANATINIECYLIFDTKFDDYKEFGSKLDKFCLIFDTYSEYGELYGTKLESGVLQDKLTKALFVINKDGSIFYIDMPEDLSQVIDMTRLQYELNRAYTTYTGVGCSG